MAYLLHDAAGRLVKEGNKSYTYAWLDKLVSVTEAGKVSANFDYHPDGQIASVTYADGRRENYLWDGLALIHRNGTDILNEPAITGGNPVLSGDKVLFNDLLGNTLGVKDQSSYQPIRMTAFGESDNADAFFTGKPLVGELGYTFLFRNYRPEQGKWQTSDPLGYPDGWNNFSYCGNNVNSIDFLGLWNLFKWIYTGDGNASDDIYNQSVEAAGETYLNNLNSMLNTLPELGVALNYYGQTQSLVTWTDSSLIAHRVSSDPLVSAFVENFIDNTIIKIKNQKKSGSDSSISDLYVLDTFATGDLGTALIFGRFYVNASANWTVIQRDDGYYKYNASFSFSVNDKFDFSTNIHILSFGLLSLGKSFDINLSWQEFRNGVFE